VRTGKRDLTIMCTLYAVNKKNVRIRNSAPVMDVNDNHYVTIVWLSSLRVTLQLTVIQSDHLSIEPQILAVVMTVAVFFEDPAPFYKWNVISRKGNEKS